MAEYVIKEVIPKSGSHFQDEVIVGLAIDDDGVYIDKE